MSAPDDLPRSLGRLGMRIFWSVLGLAVAYALSIGPAMVIIFRLCAPRPEDPPAVASKREACAKAIDAFYSPLVAMSRASKTGPLLGLYADWWAYTFQPKGGYRFGSGHAIFSSPTKNEWVPDILPTPPDLPPSAPDTSAPEPAPATP